MMSRVIKQLFLLDVTYQSNSLLFYLQKFPLIGKYVPSSIYAMKCVKVLASIFCVLISVVMMFLSKLVYSFAVSMISGLVFSLQIGKTDSDFTFLLIFLGLSIAGGWGNSRMLEPKKEQYYAVIFMRMNAKTVALTTFFKHMFMLTIGFLPAFLLIPAFKAFDLLMLASIYVVLISSKVIGASIKLKIYSKEPYANYLKMSKKDLIGSAILSLLVVPFIILGLAPNAIQMIIIATAFLLISILSSMYILKFTKYNSVYKQILSQWNGGVGKVTLNTKNTKKFSEKYISEGGDIDGSKRGFDFLAECFNKRHRKLLLNTTRIYVVGTTILAAIAIGTCLIRPDIGAVINQNVLRAIPLLTFLMYFINCGERIVKIYFINCDNEMLTYRAYRQPKAILKMFTLRLKSIVLMDWFQSAPIAIALPIILYISGGTEHPYEYVILFASVLALSTFFSVHNLVIYYMLQPFNKDVQMKNPVYMVVRSVTYLVCYGSYVSDANPIILGIGIVIFTLIYIIIALPVTYKIAPNTFRLK